ncbi:PucR family transcriptional regulator [Agromyces aerolatus]|uniref:PucR family transcriptional regulator n=1 Tax=Agromyces sp. LY-1074 TaxID=3074080 RepID=UPI00285D122A|nr:MULTISPECIES: helix-turn-helix domain-containing protein [unclassified Agromyces]MDR5699326.1 helix-turn-helix domain-containing protein [Agromyces sp. LY-1074]MDR5705622.1 helix-turn-helix domain-containing protein [Agromyces sp. LY-1358]
MGSRFDGDAAISVRQLLGVPALSPATLLAGEAGLDAAVTSVQLAPEGRRRFAIGEGSVIIIDGGRISTDTYFLDLALRWSAESRASLVLVARPGSEVGLAPRRLSKRLALPLATIDTDTFVLADVLRTVVTEPDRKLAELTISAVSALNRVSARDGIEGALRAVDATLDATSSVVGIEGGVIAGAQLVAPLPARDRLHVYTMTTAEHVARAVQPVTLALNEAPSFWLVTERSTPTAYWRKAAELVLKVASRYIAIALLTERLTQERDARYRLGVLDTIIASDHIDATVVHQVGVLGWPVEGWCSAVHIQLGGDADQVQVLAQTAEVRAVLQRARLTGAVIERPDGWTTWGFDILEPKPAAFRELAQRLRRTFGEYVAQRDVPRISIGIGRPYHGLAGLRTSLAEAREAATIAHASGARLAVQHSDELGVARILVGWYTSSEFAEFSRTLLRPLLELEGGAELVRTLEVFLDSESSPTLTADLLRVHRNTIMNRLSRIKEALAADLQDPDERLAVQLACRVVNLGEPD